MLFGITGLSSDLWHLFTSHAATKGAYLWDLWLRRPVTETSSGFMPKPELSQWCMSTYSCSVILLYMFYLFVPYPLALLQECAIKNVTSAILHWESALFEAGYVVHWINLHELHAKSPCEVEMNWALLLHSKGEGWTEWTMLICQHTVQATGNGNFEHTIAGQDLS